jgi:hypothetical protein
MSSEQLVTVMLQSSDGKDMPLEYHGDVKHLSTPHTHTRCEKQFSDSGVGLESEDVSNLGVSTAIRRIVALAREHSDGTELLRNFHTHVHTHTFGEKDISPLLLHTFAHAGPHMHTQKRLGKSGEVWIPEVMYYDNVAGCVCVAEGKGTLRDAHTGICLYEGQFLCGMRHGHGKANIYSRECGERVSDSLQKLGEYHGDWQFGQRHGHGIQVEVGDYSFFFDFI